METYLHFPHELHPIAGGAHEWITRRPSVKRLAVGIASAESLTPAPPPDPVYGCLAKISYVFADNADACSCGCR